jgi:hypothetical protein
MWWRRSWVLGLLRFEFVGEVAEGGGDIAEGGDGFATNFGDDGGVDVGSGMADFHLDEFDGFFDALSDTAWIWSAGRWRRWGITTHRESLRGNLVKNPLPVWADGMGASTGESSGQGVGVSD